MPTLQQLPLARITNPTDQVLLQQGTETTAVTLATMLAGTQAALTLATGTLLGRVSTAAGSPEPVAMGAGLAVENGALTLAPITITGDVIGGGVGTIDLTMPAITTAGTYTKVTVNPKGQVTAGGALAANDVVAALGYAPYSNANPDGFLTSEALAPFAPLASPALTGTPTAPTPPVADDSQAIATTAFVQAQLPPATTPGTFDKVTVNARGLVTAGASLGSADVTAALGFTPYSSTNPAGFTSSAKLSTFPVMAYGAFFDGVHDDQPAIMAAIAAAAAAGGGTVLLPPGHGCLANMITQTNENVHIVGAGVASPYHLTTASYDVGTVLTWIGAAGGTMIAVGPAENIVSGRSISNADLRGILFDCASRAGVGVLIASTNFSTFDLGYYQPLQCGVRFSTVCLQAQQNASSAFEINDCQHNTISIIGTAINFTSSTVATAVPPAGSNTVAVTSAAGFVAGMQVKVGSNLYIVQGVSGNTLAFAGAVTPQDGTAGNTVAFFPRGVWLHGTTVSALPSGLYPISFTGTSQYPAVWVGNVSLLRFTNIVIEHYTPGDGFVFGFSDHNAVDKLVVYSLSGANGVVFDGSDEGAVSGQNRIDYCSAGMIVARGTATYANPSQDGTIGFLDTHNGTSYPVVETGASVHVSTDTDLHYGARLINPIIFEAGWEPITGTFTIDSLASLTVVNNASDHLRLADALGGYDASINIDGITGNLRIYPDSGKSVVIGEAGSPVSVLGSLAVGGAVSMPGTVTAGSLVVTGPIAAQSLTTQTPAANDSSQNAATTAWVNARGYVQQVPTIAALRAVTMSGLVDGTVMMVDAYATRSDNGGGLFTWNAAATSADNGGTIVNPTGNTATGRWLRQLLGNRVTPQMFGAKGDGATDDTAAFNAALSTGPIYVPAAIYAVANITVPNAALIEGDVGLGYSGDIASGTPTSIQQITPVRPILLAKPGTTSCILNVYGNIDAIIKGVFLDGGDNTATCDGISSGSTRLTMERVTVVRCVNGLGSQANHDLYTHVATIIDCEFANNVNGVANLIDSVMLGGAVSANTVGVNLGSGANANNFIGTRFEWSIQDGLQGYQASSNQIIGGLFDRNSWRGANLGQGCADWTFTGVQFARNGSSNVYPNNAHVALNGTTSVFFTGCITRTGTNDNGTGTLSPAYAFNYINSNALVTISSSDVSGYVTAAFNGPNPTAYVQRDNDGGGDTIVTAARPYMSSGVVAQTLLSKAGANITPGQSTTIAVGQSPLTNNYSVTGRELVVTATNFNAPYQSCCARFNLAFYRDTAVHAPSASAAYGEAGGTGLITWGGSGKLQLSAGSVASDGSAWTLTITNGGSTDTSNWGVWAELH